MTLKTSLLCIYLLTRLTLEAQDITLNGRILSNEDNQPIQNVTIRKMDSNVTTVSDRFGNFEITVPENSILLFSKEGFTADQLTIGNQSNVIIRLKRINIISVGYNEVLKSDITSVIATVQSKDFNVGVINSPEQLFQGKAAGVQVTVGSGEPGGMVHTYIRGISSIQGSNPLFVVDGFPLSNNDVYASSTDFGRGTSYPRDPLNFINPSDIERIDILKDASSAAIYGSRGNNGVVLIKTRTGSNVKNRLQFNSQISLSNQRKYFDLLDREQFLNGIAGFGIDPSVLDYGADTDWQKEVNQSAISQKYDLSYSNMYKSGDYTVSLGYNNQPGVIKESGLSRIMGRLNWNHALMNNRLQIMGRLSASTIQDEYAMITTNAGFQGDLLGSVIIANPTWETDPTIQHAAISSNPLSILKYHQDNSKTNRTLINVSLNYVISDNISVGLNAGKDLATSSRDAIVSPDLNMGNGIFGNGRASNKTRETSNDMFEVLGKYEKTFKTSRITGLVGYAYQKFSQDEDKTEGWGFNSSGFTDIINDLKSSVSKIRNSITGSYHQYGYTGDSFFISQLYPTPRVIDLTSVKPIVPVRSVIEEHYKTADNQQSFFARVNYSIQSKYFLKASVRVDGSSLFGANHKHGLFPALSAEWRLSEEEFVSSFFSDLKLRVGFGISGGQNIPYKANEESAQFSSLAIGTNGFVPLPGYYLTSIDNPELKWEQTSEINVGVDFGIFRNKLQGSFEIYCKTTTDFLYFRPVAQPAIFPYQFSNADGEIVNAGAEVTLYYLAVNKNKFDLNLEMNLAYNSNIVKNFNGILEAGQVFGGGLTGATVQRIENEQPLYSYHLQKFTGFDVNGYNAFEGTPKFVGQDPIPNFVLGFGFNAQFKNWHAGILFSGLMGHSMYDNTANAYFTAGSFANGRNVTTLVLTSGESQYNEPEVSTRFLEKADFVRMQNATIGYNFYFDKRPFKSIRTYFSGQNLFVWTNYSGLDPDINNGKIGMDYSSYPKPTVLTLGLQVTF